MLWQKHLCWFIFSSFNIVTSFSLLLASFVIHARPMLQIMLGNTQLFLLALYFWTSIYWYVTIFVGYLYAAPVQTEEVSRCYFVNGNSSCYYTDGSMLSWDDAKEFCDSKNATLPIITDEDIDNVFQQFVGGDANSVIRDRSLWIGAHVQPVTSLSWPWVNGTSSSRPTDNIIITIL